jgi:hypothetical protein
MSILRKAQLSGTEAEVFIARLWYVIEKNQIPSPTIKLSCDAGERINIHFEFDLDAHSDLVQAELVDMSMPDIVPSTTLDPPPPQSGVPEPIRRSVATALIAIAREPRPPSSGTGTKKDPGKTTLHDTEGFTGWRSFARPVEPQRDIVETGGGSGLDFSA